MSDLISRRTLIRNISKVCGDCGIVLPDQVIDMITAQPTAYDVEKVALELRHLAFRLPKDYCGLDGKDRAVMFDDVIDIVKAGRIKEVFD